MSLCRGESHVDQHTDHSWCVWRARLPGSEDTGDRGLCVQVMTSLLISGTLLLTGGIHLLPVSGVLGPSHLQSLYGLSFLSHEPNLLLLLRHRAVLFGILGCFQIASVFKKEWRAAALMGGLVSMASFVILTGSDAFSSGKFNPAIRRVWLIDVISSIALTIASAAYLAIEESK